MRPGINITLCKAVLVAALLWPATAGADCTLSGVTYTCTGELSGGLDFVNGPEVLIVKDLTADIAPQDGDPGVAASAIDAEDWPIEISFTGDGFAIVTHGAGVAGLSQGAPGKDGEDHAPFPGEGTGGDGTEGTAGGKVTLTLVDAEIFPGQSQQGTLVSARSLGAKGGSGGEGTGHGATGQGGSGGRGSDSGTTQITVNGGSFTTTSPGGSVFLAEAEGGEGGVAGEGDGAPGSGNGGVGGDGGTGAFASLVLQDVGQAQSIESSATLALASSRGGDGGEGGYGKVSLPPGNANGGRGGGGGVSEGAQVTVSGGSFIQQGSGVLLLAEAVGGDGGKGGETRADVGPAQGGPAGDGGGAGPVTLMLSGGSFTVGSDGGTAILLQSRGGAGGEGGLGLTESAGVVANGGEGGAGGNGGKVIVTGGDASTSIAVKSTTGTQHGLRAESLGGAGGKGGEGDAKVFGDSKGGDGGQGGSGGDVSVDIQAMVSTLGPKGQGVFARSYGANGGDGGTANAEVGSGTGGSGAGSGPAGTAAVTFFGSITTGGEEANAIIVQSVGGFSGNAGDASGFLAYGAGSQSAGKGDTVSASLIGGSSITTNGEHATAVLAQSVGGGGGRGSSGQGIEALGGTGSSGGDGGTVTVDIGQVGSGKVSITTAGLGSRAIHGASTGGGGGDGGGADGIVALGGSSGSGGDGGKVTITSSGDFTTLDDRADGIYASSTGGGGGSAHAVGGLYALGGTGGDGGSGGAVQVGALGTIATTGDDADGIYLHSLGGGGGHGSAALSAAPLVSVAIGGSGGGGGDGGATTFDNGNESALAVTTKGDRARGLMALSVGGGGGDGGNAISVSASPAISVSVGASGDGGKGGDGGAVNVTAGGSYATAGSSAPALQAQSSGGGGGNAGTTVSSANGALSASLALGGKGGGGGDGGSVTVNSISELTTTGDVSGGLVAHSTGGGGGHGGTTVGAGEGALLGVDVAVGGAGGDGGDGGMVKAGGLGSGSISTSGAASPGLYAHSVGGGGGYSGTSVAGSLISEISVNAAVGGKGGGGGKGGAVVVDTESSIATLGDISDGIKALSVGGGGGHSGVTAAGSVASQLAVDASVGGKGGSGGDAGTVQVTAREEIATKGHSSAGIAAYSVGGGGGDAQFTGAASGVSTGSLNVAVGGGGGVAGDGSDVTVEAEGKITTTGHNAPGIAAYSVGGGGGDSGTTVSGALASRGAVGVTVGGDGGSSGDPGAVSVASGGDITTSGHHALGIHAKSVARAGGNAGTVVTGTGIAIGDVGVSVGGSGGKGGTSALAKVSNDGAVTTAGSYASAIVAQSIAGGGGSAKGTVTGSGLSAGNVSVTIGGAGGSGGTAGNVEVTNSGALSTGLHHAYGILAQSHGGAGGDGGFAAEGSFTAGEMTGQLGVTIGGEGGGGGQAGSVSVLSQGSIATADFGAIAIHAQSVGGNGGNGGNVYSGNFSFSSEGSAQIDVDIGGAGGAGAKAETVEVDNSGDITTDGYLAKAVFAQSIGGNGGNGGNTYSVVGGLSTSATANVSVDVGGHGGSGAVAGQVSLSNSGTITTMKALSDGLHAQSIGGGGGNGGSAANFNLELSPSTPSGTSVNFNAGISVGGKGGSGNDGAAVLVTNTDAIVTQGESSRGIYAHSVGGGGGDGGTASSMSFSVGGVCKLIAKATKYSCTASDDPEEEGTEVEVTLNVVVGGDGAGGGDGGAVTAMNQGAITTSGKLAYGIAAQSHGGGGGNGGLGDIGLAGFTTNATANAIDKVVDTFSELPSFTNQSAAVGGSGGAAGDGAGVEVTNTETITTKGDHAFAIHAQSVGGGGGNAGAGNSGLWSAVTLGGRGSGGGDGGDVTVTSSGYITTGGEGGVGIFAQSVGGGGGTAGDVEKAFAQGWGDLNIGAGVGIQESSGAGGSGGDITVTLGGSGIQTGGTRAHGLVLQSIGGSGGAVGIDGALEPINFNTWAGNVGDAGSAGKITATVNAPITLSGAQAHGIFAQSAAGNGDSDTSGDIVIDVNADIMAGGPQGRAILAQSVIGREKGADFGTGSIEITIAEGVEVMTGPEGWETIGLLEGSQNTITNKGVLIQAGGLEAKGYVVRTDGNAALKIENYGLLSGSVTVSGDQPQAITLNSLEGSILQLGSEMDLGGPNGLVSSSGILAVGANNTIGTSVINGTIDQSGTYLVDLEFGGSADLISMTNSQINGVSGKIDPNPQGKAPANGESGSFKIFEAGSTAFVPGSLTVADTATVDYAVTVTQSNDIELGYKVDYSPWATTTTLGADLSDQSRAKLGANHDSIADHMDELVEASRSGSLSAEGAAFVDELALSLVTTEEADSLVDTYDSLAPGEIFAPTDASLFSSLRFSDSLMSCPERSQEGVVTFTREGSCLWLRSSGGGINRQRTDDSIDYDETLFGFSGGGQTALGEGFFLGAAFAYEHSNLSNAGFGGNGDRYQGGIVVKKEIGKTTLAGALSGGVGRYDLSREVATPGGKVTADSDPDTNWIAVHGRASHLVELNEQLYLEPWFGVGVTRQWQGAYQESGAGNYGLDVDSFNTTTVTLNPALEFGGSFDLFGAQAKASASAGMLALVSGRDRSTEVSFLGVGSGGPSFPVSDQARPLFADLGASLEVAVHDRAVISVSAGTLLAGHQQEYGGAGRISIFF